MASMLRINALTSAGLVLAYLLLGPVAQGWAQTDPPPAPDWVPQGLVEQFPLTDWSRHTPELGEIRSGGPDRDGVPAIDAPVFAPAVQVRAIRDQEPVIGVVSSQPGGPAKAYPLMLMIWHGVVNDVFGDQQILVSFDPLTGTASVRDPVVEGEPLVFGVTGTLRVANMMLYDRTTESWWQQATGQGVIGTHMGAEMPLLPFRLESFGEFKQRAPDGLVMVPENPRAMKYGENPYWGLDRERRPKFYDGPVPDDIAAMERVVVVPRQGQAPLMLPLSAIADRAPWPLPGGLVANFLPNQVSALDAPRIAFSRTIGGAVITDGAGQDLPAQTLFAFAAAVFFPDAEKIGF